MLNYVLNISASDFRDFLYLQLSGFGIFGCRNRGYLNLHKNSLLSKLADKKTDIPGKQRVIGVATLLHASILRVFA